jgi:UDP-N-acetylglucosamine--N-acetylmuramyl-(pentapeptide) pyrophosphoryl-undecaprenol N-acetylglucosamine transferase
VLRASSTPCVLFAAGQTAGHVNPALAVAHNLRQQCPDACVHFAATDVGYERRFIAAAGYPTHIVRAAPFRGGSWARWITGGAALPTAFVDAAALIRDVSPDAVVGTGGYLSAAILLTAAQRGVPTLIIEPNVRPGVANRCLAPFVDVAAVAWPATAAALGRRARVVGNPVRPALFELKPRAFDQSFNVLVLGGTHGSAALNRAIAGALPILSRERTRLTIAHQTGHRQGAGVRSSADMDGVIVRAATFFDDIASEYAWADLVVSTAGATTCAELAATGRPAILIPLAVAGHHQRANADAMAGAGAGVVIDESVLTPATLAEAILTLVRDRERRHALATNARRLARPRAAQIVASLVLQLAGATNPLGDERHEASTLRDAPFACLDAPRPELPR